jgi:NAD(P)-dependent dehydrogenase (short-subunit alcohol dehydrogenase family)
MPSPSPDRTPSPFTLSGRVAWITGGTKGLGLQMARALANAGAHLALNSRHGDEAVAVARQLAEAHGVRTFGGAADVGQEAQVLEFVAQARAALGPIDILVANAGINIRKPTVDQTLDDWNQVLSTNLTGPFLCSRAVLPGMAERRWGRVIHVASMVGLVGLAARPSYTATKGALVQLTRTQALEMAPHGVTVNALCPGPFGTEMNKPLLEDPKKYAEFVSRIPLGRWGDLPEIEGPIVFLASNASSFMTGATLVVDGGWTAQ